MTRSHLRLLMPAFVVLAGGLFLGCENQIEAPDAITLQTRSAVEVLPADIRFVGMVNLEAMQRNSAFNPFNEMGMGGGEMGARLEDFIETTGFDPEKDLREVYLATNDTGPEGQPSIVAYANYDPDRLHDYVENNLGDAFDRTHYKGVTIYRANDDDRFAFALATDNMVVASAGVAGVEAMLDRLAGEGTALKDDAETMALIAAASTGSNAWFVARNIGEEFASHKREPDSNDALTRDVNQIGQALTNVAVSLTMQDDGADARVFMQTRAGVEASDVAALTKGVIAAMKLSDEADETTLRMLDNARVRSQGDQVQVNLFVDNATLSTVR